MMRLYASYDDEHLRAYWDSIHAFSVSIAKRRASRYLEAFYTDRKQRRSRAGARWKSFLQHVLTGLLRGSCDMDLLLDPFFLKFPRPGEAGAWCSGIEDGADPGGGDHYEQGRSLAQPLSRRARDSPGAWDRSSSRKVRALLFLIACCPYVFASNL
ncbi:hypothetical protein F442_22239 [Phytophthora nicotianae P10297]|uniref:Uncharacterized protein n=1 Tax=Phytophthora nicotianae P10297 TaxID=1317064 RepID=W2Y029_PHYNI|nr:hypothetical protein F442_22239 [Phytophthora nicotianae P10297]